MASSVYSASEIRRRIAAEGRVFRVAPEGPLGIFDPHLIASVNEDNFRGSRLPQRLSDFGTFKEKSAPVDWGDVRAVLIAQSRQLCAGSRLGQVYKDMRDALVQCAAAEVDLTWAAARAVTKPLIPLTIGGMLRRDAALVDSAQVLGLRALFNNKGRLAYSDRMRRFVAGSRAGFAVARTLRRRTLDSSAPCEDMAQAVLPLLPSLGLSRASYVVTMMLAAVGGAPGPVAACLLYELKTRPEWEQSIQGELARLSAHQLFSGAARTAPITHRFLRETLRVCSFPMLALRAVRKTLHVDGYTLAPGDAYILSAYIAHHDQEHWRDPEKFDPDRWLDPTADRSGCAYVPFGWAPRVCLGASIGFAQLFLFCKLITTEFDIEVSDLPSAYIDRSMGLALPREFRGTISPRMVRGT